MLQTIGADAAENERNFAKNWQLPYGSQRFGEALCCRITVDLFILSILTVPPAAPRLAR